MDRLDRIFALHRILKSRRYPVGRDVLAGELACSESTIYRVRDALITYFSAPVEIESGTGKLYYPRDEAEEFELPGLWFNPSELYALLTANQLLTDIQPGVLAAEITPLRERIQRILDHRHLGAGELGTRVRILSMAARPVDTNVFHHVAAALIERRRLTFTYRSRSRSNSAGRDVSPQRLTRYRDNWYLDTWDHQRDDLRCFSLDRIETPRPSSETARDIDESELHARLATTYGIFSGAPENTAVLRFDRGRAEWIADETWHPQQQGRWLDDGRLELRIPYADPTELILDILRYGDEVEVVEPDELRDAVAQKLGNAAARYR